MYCDTEEGMNQWIAKINQAIENISNKGYSDTKIEVEEDITEPNEENKDSNWVQPKLRHSVIKEEQEMKECSYYIGIAKNYFPYIVGEPNLRSNEFINVWEESIPKINEVQNLINGIINCDICVSANMTRLIWRVSGLQSHFIQKMVNFFSTVGAVEREIDKLNEVGAIIIPKVIGTWIEMSNKDGMDGGWFFSDFPINQTILTETILPVADAGRPIEIITQWITKHNISISTSIGRDMGSAPPNQTEIICELPGNLEKQIEIALDAFDTFEYPPFPTCVIDLLKTYSNPGILLSIGSSSDGFVRTGILVPNPSIEYIDKLCEIAAASHEDIHDFEKLISKKPKYVEYQYLKQGCGYGVYNEGLDILFHYSLYTYNKPQ